MKDQNYTFVTVAHEADFMAMQIQARSLAFYCPPDLIDEVIVIENFKTGSAFSWQSALLKEYAHLSDRIRFVAASSFEPIPKAEGWWSQQLFKLLIANDIKTDIYLVLDAKNHLVKELDRSFLQNEDGRAKIYAEGYRGHPLEFYFNEVCRYFHLDPQNIIDRFITTAPPFPMYTEEVKRLMQDISNREGKGFAEFFLKGKNLTEFFLYGGYLVSRGTLQDLYEMNDVACPTIWAHTTSYPAVQKLILQSQQTDAPFFGIHRTAYGHFDNATISIICDYWIAQKLFPDRPTAIKYLTALRSGQRRLTRQKYLTALPRKIVSRLRKLFRFS